MEHGEATKSGSEQESQEYHTLALLDELETLLEDLEDERLTGLDAEKGVPDDIKRRMETLGVRDVQQVRDRLRQLHAQVDEDDADLTITES